jgi:hypothetical protein
MRKLLFGLAAIGLCVGPTVAQARAGDTTNMPESQYSTNEPLTGLRYRVRLDRSLFDQVGPHVNIERLCGPAGARAVENRRNGYDILLTFVSVGFYTPTHARVECNAGAPTVGRR